MDLCKSKQPFLPGMERPSVLSPPSSSPSKSPDQRRRRPKAPSESLAHDLLVQRTTLAVPGYAANNNNNRYRRAHRAEGEESTEDEEEEEEDYDSFQLTGYPELATKDRFKSASLEWTTGPNGVVTPRASHYNTHPPLDFKSLKEKLKRLIGSPHETYRKPFAGFSSSSASFTSGHDERKTGVISGLHSVPYVTSPSADMMCSAETADGHRATSSAETREESLKNAAKDSYLSERSNKVPWKDVANHVAETDKALQKILIRHYKELEDLKKKHEHQWIQLRSHISRSKDVQNLGRELMLNAGVRCNQTLSRSKSDVQLTALNFGAATKTPNHINSKSQFSEIGSRECVTSKHTDAVCPVTANFADSYKDVHARPGGNAAATPKETCPYVQRDANYTLPFVNSHRTGSLYHTVSGLPQLTRPADAHCVSPMMQRQSELEMAKQLENQMAALISQRMMHQQLNLELAAKAQRPSLGAGFYALPNGCFQYSCMPVFQQLQSPTMFAALPVYQEPICPPANTFPGAGTFPPWNPRTEFPQRIGSRTPCRELVQHHHHVPGNALPDPSSRQVLCSSLDQLALPSEMTRISASFAASSFAAKTQPPAPPQMPCFDNYLNRGYNNFPCFLNSFPSVPMSFLHPSMQYPPPDFKDIHQTLIPQPLDHQPYLTWS